MDTIPTDFHVTAYKTARLIVIIRQLLKKPINVQRKFTWNRQRNEDAHKMMAIIYVTRFNRAVKAFANWGTHVKEKHKTGFITQWLWEST